MPGRPGLSRAPGSRPYFNHRRSSPHRWGRIFTRFVHLVLHLFTCWLRWSPRLFPGAFHWPARGGAPTSTPWSTRLTWVLCTLSLHLLPRYRRRSPPQCRSTHSIGISLADESTGITGCLTTMLAGPSLSGLPSPGRRLDGEGWLNFCFSRWFRWLRRLGWPSLDRSCRSD